MQQKKRHHFVPKAYLKAFCDEAGRLLVYRKDGPPEPLRVAPDATQFRRYYYSQPTADGSQDNNKLEEFFSSIEGAWAETVARLGRREDVNDRLESIFEFIALQRVRVPASRDVAEAVLAQSVKDAMRVMLARGEIPSPPAGYESLPDQVQVSIDPHRSIHAMVAMMQGIGALFSKLGLAAIHNHTSLPFLTSDNPVIWFDQSLPFDRQKPYTIDIESGSVFLFFPVSPTVAIVGTKEYQEGFGRNGMQYGEVPAEDWVRVVNAQTCRFAYEAVIASSAGQEEVIAQYAAISPVHEAVELQVGKGQATIHRQVFGPRPLKPKWKDKP